MLAHNSKRMVGTARGLFLIAVAEVFIRSFNDNGANKQSQIKTNFGPPRGLICSKPSSVTRIHLRPCLYASAPPPATDGTDALSKRASQINTSRRKLCCRSNADRKRHYSECRSVLWSSRMSVRIHNRSMENRR